MVAIEMSNFSNNLRLLLEKHNIGISKLSKEIDVTISTLSKLLNGGIEDPRAKTLTEIANYFNVSVDELLGLKPFQVTSKDNIAYNIPIFNLDNLEHEQEKFITSKFYRSLTINNAEKEYFIVSTDSPAMYPFIDKYTQVLIKKTNSPKNKQYVLFKTINNEYFIRQFLKDGENIILKPYSSDFGILKFDQNMEIIGVAIELFRDLE